MNGRERESGSPPEIEETNRPSKRQRRTATTDELQADARTSRQNKACSNCRKLKVKCDPATDQSSCTRCTRLGLVCLREKRSWANADDDAWQTQLTLVKLERALEDVLEKLHMPALDLYVQPSIIKPHQAPRSTRHNSEEPAENQRDVSPAPMNSLIEATQLNGLRSQIRPLKQRRKGGGRRMDSDLISEKLLTLQDADEMLDLFKRSLSPHLFSGSIPRDATIESLRRSSTVLFTAVILVSALHMPGKEMLHEMCHKRFLGLVSSIMFDRFHSLDDIRGLCIAAFWQPYLSWKLSGLSIRMATELNLHHAFYEAFNEPSISPDAQKDALEKARLWYVLYVLDHQSSITYGRPSVMTELRPVKDHQILLSSESCTPPDRMLISQVTGLVILSRAFDQFGLEPKRTMAGDDATVMGHMRYTEDMKGWRDKFMKLEEADPEAATSLYRSVDLHYHFSNLVLNSLVLRGRPLDKLSELPASLRPLALNAVEAAHAILQHFLDEPRYREEIVGMPLYLHSMIAFAAVFLIKLSPRWHGIGITIDAAHRTIPLVEEVIKLLQGCKAGANHMIYSMAKGFERMLRQLRRSNQVNVQHPSPVQMMQWHQSAQSKDHTTAGISNMLYPEPIPPGTDYYNSGMTGSAGEMPPNYGSPNTTTSRLSQQLNWGFQDDELWSVGMGYDLLEPGGQGLASMDFPFQISSYSDTLPML